MNVAFIIKTDCLDYDDRVRKQALVISAFANVKIFVLEDKNQRHHGFTSYGIPFSSIHLKTRELFPSGRFLWLKSLAFYWAIKSELNKFDFIWVHDVAPFLFLLSRTNSRCFVWDLHEIPQMFCASRFRRMFFRYLVEKSLLVLHANQQRINYLSECGLVHNGSKHLVVRNFPDDALLKSSEEEMQYQQFRVWMNDSDCIYLQGLVGRARYPRETIEAIVEHGVFKAVVVGLFDHADKAELLEKYKGRLAENVYFIGQIKQMEIPKYMSLCKFTMVFYESRTPNNHYCEPNRLYQAVAAGLPAIVGSNESMRELVDRFGFGVVASTDGRDVDCVVAAIRGLVLNYDRYLENVAKHRSEILWESQYPVFGEIHRRLTKAYEGAAQ